MSRSAPRGAAGNGVDIRSALAIVQRDPRWLVKSLLHGALALTVLGLPIAAGFVVESYENTRKGYPTPLPPWADWTLRWLAGLLALLIDFVFFVLPLLVGAFVMFCIGLAFLVAGLVDSLTTSNAAGVIVALSGGFLGFMFLSSVSPVARLLFVHEGRIEEALSMKVLAWALSAPARRAFFQARLLSLLAYLPAILCGIGLFSLAQIVFPFQLAVIVILAWLMSSAIVYAHLVIVQLYVAAEKVIERRRLGME